MKRAKPSDLSGNLRFRSVNLLLINFKVSPRTPPRRRKTVVSEVLKGNLKEWPNAFVVKMRNGHIGVFTRETSNRFPIQQRYSTSVPQMIEQVYLNNPNLQNQIQQVVEIKIDEQVNKILAKAFK